MTPNTLLDQIPKYVCPCFQNYYKIFLLLLLKKKKRLLLKKLELTKITKFKNEF